MEDSKTREKLAKSLTARASSASTMVLRKLFTRVDIASLAYFRIVFGAIMVWEVWRYFSHAWIRTFYIEPPFFFTYYGFDWVSPWPGVGMHLHFLALGVLVAFIALGFFYRVSAALFFLGFTYVFLLDQTNFLNHFYLISLVSLLMVFIPANKAFSLDAWMRPGIRSETAPAWAVGALAAQMGVAYFYGGLAKLNADWLRGEPMRAWLENRTDFPLIGPLFTEKWAAYAFSYGGLAFDLLIVPFLLWRKTRVLAFTAVILFHLMNSQLFSIGVFPWFAIAITALFFPPSWPRRIAKRLGFGEDLDLRREASNPPTLFTGRQIAAASLLVLFFAVQMFVPLRHFLYPSNVSWSNEGSRFAWHMKLRSLSGEATFYAVDPKSNQTWEIDPNNHLTPRQVAKMSPQPDMLIQFAHEISDVFIEDGYEDVEVRAEVWASLNGREPQLLIDPAVDLAQEKQSLATKTWILPLDTDLPAAEARIS